MENDRSASRRTLERALRHVGDRQRLAEMLGVGLDDLEAWMLGPHMLPHEVFLRALDLAFPKALPLAPKRHDAPPVPDADETSGR